MRDKWTFGAKLASWTCPICDRKGRKWISHYKARWHGRQHMLKFHGVDEYPDIIFKGE